MWEVKGAESSGTRERETELLFRDFYKTCTLYRAHIQAGKGYKYAGWGWIHVSLSRLCQHDSRDRVAVPRLLVWRNPPAPPIVYKSASFAGNSFSCTSL